MKIPRLSPSVFLVSIALLILLGPSSLWPPMTQAQPAYPVTPASISDHAYLSTVLHSTPLMFIENVGQFDRHARFQVRTDKATLYLTESELWLTLLAPAEETAETQLCSGVADRPSPTLLTPCTLAQPPRRGLALKLTFPGANPHPRLEPFNRLETQVSYFIGNDPAGWRTDVPVWGGVRYVDLYPGLNLEISGERGEWTWRLAVQPGAEEQGGQEAGERSSALTPLHPGSKVRLQVEGAEALALDGGRLRLVTSLGEFSLPLLQAVAADGTSLDLPAARPVIAGRAIRAPFVTPQTNLQSPQDNPNDLAYSTFLGRSGDEFGNGIDVDGAGNTYVAGWTNSTDFSTTVGAFDTSYGGVYDIFVAKLNANGTGLAYATFVGGSYADISHALTVDAAGNAYLTGHTLSADFPTTAGAFDTSHNGQDDVFIVKLNVSGTDLIYATLLGGSDRDIGGYGIAVDGVGNVYLTGWTGSADFPATVGAFDINYNGDASDAFVAKLNASGTGLVYATFLGGVSFESGKYIAVDEVGSAYVAGRTASVNFPTTDGAFTTTHNGLLDGFVVKFSPDGTQLIYATFLGGSSSDCVSGNCTIAVDKANNVYVTGDTYSADFPTTPGAFDTSYNGQGDAFVVKLNAAGTGLVYATFLGGSRLDRGSDITMGEMGGVYLTGGTESPDFPTTVGAFDTSYGGGTCGIPPDTFPCFDVFVVRLNFDGTKLTYATFLGEGSEDNSSSIAVDEVGSVHLTGATNSPAFPTTLGAFDPSYNGNLDVFVTKLTLRPNLSPSTKQASAVRVAPGQLVTYTVTLNNIGGNDAPSAHLTDTLPTSLIYQPGSLGADTGSYGQAGGVITWAGSLASGASAVVHYAVMVSPGLAISETAALRNTAWLDDGVNAPFERAAVVFINPQEVYLPLVTKP